MRVSLPAFAGPVLLLAALVAPVPARAHGESAGHGAHAAATAVDGTGPVTIGGYRIELVSHPGPPAVGQETRLLARIADAASGIPVSGGRVLVGVAAADATPELRPAPEMTWAGSYGLAVIPARPGRHHVQVAVDELDGRPFHPRLLVEFPLTVAPAPGLGAGVWILLTVVTGLAGAAVYGMRVRSRFLRPAETRLNLLDVPALRRLVTSPVLQPALQLPMLGVMAVVVVVGFTDVQDGGMNLATKLTWTIWWAGIIFTFFLAGRVWCLACPFGALNEWAARLARPLRRLPRPFRNVWWATAMFVLLTWADELLGVVRSPWVTAGIVVFFAAAAVAVGLFYERRSFCRHLCPIGGLIGIYSMAAPLELRPKAAAVCAADREKACYRGDAQGSGCPMFEFPGSLDRNNYCTLCARCATACAHDNLVLRFRRFGEDLWAAKRRLLDESYLAVVLVGLTLLVTAQMLTAWPAWVSALARWLPGWLRSGVKPVTYLGLVESALLLGGSLLVGPLVVLGGVALADRLAGRHRVGLRRAFVTFGYMFVPVGLAMHLAHNLEHLLLEGGGIVPVVQRALLVYTPFSLGTPDWHVAPLAPAPVVAVAQVAVVLGFFALTLTAGYRLVDRTYPDAGAASRAFAPLAALALVFTLAAIVLLSQPMAMRHGM